MPAALSAWLAAFLALAAPPPAVLRGILLVAAAVGGWFLLRRRASGVTALSTAELVVVAAVVCALGAAGAAALRIAAVRAGPVPALAAERAVVEARLVLTSDPVRRRQDGGSGREMVTVSARLQRVDAARRQYLVRAPVVVLADAAWLDLLPGQSIVADGRLVRPRDDNVAALLVARGPPRLDGSPPSIQRAAGVLRHGLRTAVSDLPIGPRALVPGLVVGDVSQMPPELEQDFQTTGLTHLVAVSGANCAIVMGFVLLTARWAGVRGRALPALCALALLGFLVLARPQPSVLRATVMGLVAVAALASGRRRAGMPALCAAALALVLVDPWMARTYGFVLSVLATAGLIVFAGPWTDVLARAMPRPLAAALAVPAAAQVVCAPVVVLLSAQVSLAAVPANLLVAPAVPPATVLGVMAAVLAPVSAPAAAVAGTLAGVPASWIVAVASTSARMPGAAIDWPSGVRGAALLAGLTVVGLVALPVLLRRPRLIALGTAVAVAATLPAAATRRGWPPPGWVLIACDVGQGDALVLNAGHDTAVVVDAGPDPRAVDRCLSRIGVRQVAALLLTHPHADHVDGVPGVLRRRRVGEVVLGPADGAAGFTAGAPGGQADRLVARLLGEVPVRRAVLGETSTVGRLTWRVVGPPRILREGSVANNTSVVVAAERDGVRMLLTGDVETAGQRALQRALDADADGALDSGAVDVLKVPHHGSAEQLPSLFALVAPRVAVVSAGRGNEYGHPAPATLTLLESVAATVLRTDRDGDVAVVGPAHRLGLVRRGR